VFKNLDFDPDPEMDPEPDLDSELSEKSDPEPEPDPEIIFLAPTHWLKHSPTFLLSLATV